MAEGEAGPDGRAGAAGLIGWRTELFATQGQNAKQKVRRATRNPPNLFSIYFEILWKGLCKFVPGIY